MSILHMLWYDMIYEKYLFSQDSRSTETVHELDSGLIAILVDGENTI